MLALRKMASFVRWRLVPVRYVTMLGNLQGGASLRPPAHRMAVCDVIEQRGFHPGPTIPAEDVERANEIYRPRVGSVTRRSDGYVFSNLITPEDLRPEDPIVRFAFSPALLDVALDYFGGRAILDSIQVLYSLPSDGPPRESQLWHKDYGDSRSFHCVAYLHDVLDADSGPFVFVDKADTRRIGRSLIVRRIDDERFARELGPGNVQSFHGRAGESVFVDPAVCYHYGSRCKRPRLAVFVTFNSTTPFAPPVPLIRQNASRLFEVGRQLRPDLSQATLRTLLRLS
jgi:hypothetical protein